MDLLTEPFQYAFMQRGMLAGGLAAIVCAVVGAYVVLRGLAFMGDAVAHSSLTGMAAAYLMGGNVLWGAFAWVVPASLAISYISQRTRLRLDTSIGIIYTAGFALGIILMSRGIGYTADLFSFLFGNVLGVSWLEVLAIGGVAGGILLAIALLYKELLFASYDAAMAAASGVPVRLVEYLLPVLLGVTVVAAVKVVGIVLVLALLVVPAATASLVGRRLPSVMAYAVAFALLSTVAGVYLSFHLDLPTGPAIVLVLSALFGLAFIFSPSRGLLRRARTDTASS